MQFFLNGFRGGDPEILPAGSSWRSEVGLPSHVDVLIAGCGPAGLCLAAQLSAFPEIHTMIVEPKPGPVQKGQADGLNVRSLEMFQAFGAAVRLKREGTWINETTFWSPSPNDPCAIRRVGRIEDVAEGLSEMPHVLINQARVHDVFLDIMARSPSRLVPDYGLEVATLIVEDSGDHPVVVTLKDMRSGRFETVRARYVVGCDGARSNVREAIGGALHGDSAHQAWGVMDALLVTDFPDIRKKAIIQSNEGTVFVLPREGGYLVRLYVELDNLQENERVSDRDFRIEDTIAKANRIFAPYSIDVKEVVWSSVYEIGHRLTDKFDDVPQGNSEGRIPRVMLAGDACHTHSPKAGQGMNVSMGDTFNLGWKLISVLNGTAPPQLLHTYSQERRAAAKGLIDFDHRWSRVVGSRDDQSDPEAPRFMREFIANGEFTAGLTIRYEPSRLVGNDEFQPLANGFPIGKRFHSAPVIRLCDAQPLHLGHVIEADTRWRLFAFAAQDDHGQQGGNIDALCEFLSTSPLSPILRHTRPGTDIDSLFDLRAIFQQGFLDIEFAQLHPLLLPRKGKYGLIDYQKSFCADLRPGMDIFEQRGIDRNSGCLVIVRPDQYVANILPVVDAGERLGAFFADIFAEQMASSNLEQVEGL